MSYKLLCTVVGCSLFVVGAWIAFYGFADNVPESEYARVMLFERPLEIDRSLIDAFSLQFNGVDALNGHPSVTSREEMHVTGLLAVKPGALKHRQYLRLHMGHRLLVDGEADWESVPGKFNELSMSPAFPGKVIDCQKSVPLDPGEYEVRFYGIIESSDVSEPPPVYQIARGRLTVLPPREVDGDHS